MSTTPTSRAKISDQAIIVTKIRGGRGAVLVQWQEEGTVNRGWIPDTTIDENNNVSPATLKAAMPYGIPIEDIIGNITLKAKDIAAALHKKGIWTEEEIMKNPMAVQKAIIESAELSVHSLQARVRNFQPEYTPPDTRNDTKEVEIDAK